MKNLFEVKILTPDDDIWVINYTASHIKSVIAELNTDLMDESTTVLSIKDKGEILKELP